MGDGASGRATVVLAGAGLAALLTACGITSASHVVPPTTAVTQPASPPAPSAASTPGVPALSSQTLDEVEAELGALDGSLSQANTDINSPQGDS